MQPKAVKSIQIILAAAGLLLATLSFVNSPGTDDVKSFWEPWASKPETLGLADGFAANEAQYGYPPLSSAIFFGLSHLSRQLSISAFEAVKVAILFCLLATSIVFWAWTKNFALTVVLHMSLLINSVALGYIDIFFAPWVILSVWALKAGKRFWFTIFFSIACLIKWQPLIIAPFIVLYLLNVSRVRQWRQIDFKGLALRVLLPVVVIGSLLIVVFGTAALSMSVKTAFDNVFLSGDALNFSWIVTHWLHVFRPNDFGPLIGGEAGYIVTTVPDVTTLPKVLFYLTYAIAVMAFFKREKTFENAINFSLIGYLAYFTFNTGVHENHLFLAAILAIVLFWLNRDHLSTMIVMILMSNVNLLVFYGLDGQALSYSRVIFNWVDIALPVSIFNVIFFLVLWGINILDKRNLPDARAAPLRIP